MPNSPDKKGAVHRHGPLVSDFGFAGPDQAGFPSVRFT